MRLEQLSDKLTNAWRDRARKSTVAHTFVTALLVTIGAAIAGIAQFLDWPENGHPSPSQMVGVTATFIAGLGGLAVLAKESGSAAELALAAAAVEEVRSLEAELTEIDEIQSERDRVYEAYQSLHVICQALSSSLIAATGSVDDLIFQIVELAGRSVSLAAGFAAADQWTLCVYKAVEDTRSGEQKLKLIAHRRAIECKVEDARSWKVGVGVAGISYQRKRELVIPNMAEPGLDVVFEPGPNAREYDRTRYQSIISLPIFVNGREEPFGVVTATNDRVGYFSSQPLPEFRHDDPIRRFAELIGLVVGVRDAMGRARGSAPAIIAAS